MIKLKCLGHWSDLSQGFEFERNSTVNVKCQCQCEGQITGVTDL